MNEEISSQLKTWVKDNYNQHTTGYTYERSEGNCCDCFDDGYSSGQSWAAYEVGCILGMKLKEPEEPEED